MEALEEKKGEGIVLLDIQEIADFTSYFIICCGSSVRMLEALSDHVAESVKKKHQISSRVEGHPEDGWIVLDVGDVVVHLFTPDQRSYYQLEKLWSEGKVLLRLQ